MSTSLDAVVEVQFPNAPAGATPQVSEDGKTWRAVPLLSGTTLPAGQPDGYFRDAQNTVHILTRHFTLFALPTQAAQTKLAMSMITPPRIWTANRSFVGIHLDLTAPAKIRSWFVSSSGAATTPQVSRTLRAGANILKLRLPPRLKPGYYRIQMRADGAGQQFGRTARIQVLAKQPWSPVIAGRRPIGVLVMQGTSGLGQLAARLGPQFSVTSTLTSSVFSAADPARTKTSAVVIDLDLVPVTVVAELHAVLPELQIVGLTNNAQTAAIDRKAGATIVIAKPASVYAVSDALKRLLRTSK